MIDCPVENFLMRQEVMIFHVGLPRALRSGRSFQVQWAAVSFAALFPEALTRA
jgi:hypothetical protein